MAKNRNNLKARIRRGAGNPKVEVVPEADVDYFIDESIEEISRHSPAWAISYITIEEGVTEYSLPANIYDVVFLYSVQGVLVSDSFGEGFDALDYLVEGETYDVELYQYAKFVDSLREHDIMSQYDWEFNAFDRKIYLFTPDITAGTKLYYIGLKKWTFDTIPDRYERYIEMYGTSRTLEMYARVQRRETAVSHLGTTEPWPMSEEMLRDARRIRTDFDEYMQVEGKKAAIFLGD